MRKVVEAESSPAPQMRKNVFLAFSQKGGQLSHTLLRLKPSSTNLVSIIDMCTIRVSLHSGHIHRQLSVLVQRKSVVSIRRIGPVPLATDFPVLPTPASRPVVHTG